MVNVAEVRSWCAVLLLAALTLTAAAWLRGAEYDEQYTLFLTAGTPRPAWPEVAFPAGDVVAVQSGRSTMSSIAHDLRTTDVHPPLYFWAVSFWRAGFGPSLFAARMLSVLCGLISLSVIGAIARRCAVSPVAAMLFTLGCYGFVYTNVIARGFASAQMFTLFGIAFLIGRRPLLAGACLGAACCCNYLAVFIAATAIVMTGAWLAALPAIPFLLTDAWFFIAQHAARPGQFPPFAIWQGLQRLAEYQAAAVFGGLPLYVDGNARNVTAAAVGLLAAGIVLYVVRARPLNGGRALHLIVAAAVAPPIGLLLLGAVFDNTPIELRYLSFGLPFIALLIARAVATGSGPAETTQRKTRCAVGFGIVVTMIQFAGIAGLLLSARTMQPARAAAAEALQVVCDGIVLIPRGNDGVGIVGAFGIEAAPALSILSIRADDPIALRLAPYHRVVVALLGQDHDSVASIRMLHAALIAPDWRRIAIGSNVEIYERTGEAE